MRTLPACVLALFVAAAAAAEPVVTLRDNGPSDNRLNLVFLGDGYTAAEMLKYSRDVDYFLDAMFLQQPYADYAAYFNVQRIDVPSNESGADHPARGVVRDTALGASYDCRNTQRLICVDLAAVNAVLSRSLGPGAADAVIVLVNDPEYGGAGGSIVVSSTHAQGVEIVLHELGHSLGLLTDEYETGSCDASREPSAANATRETSREAIKWQYWIDARTPVPSNAPANGVPGLYQGSHYCAQGLYRPTYNSKMRSVGRPFEQINAEQLIKRFYNFVSPIDSVLPATSELARLRGERIELGVRRPQPTGRDLSVAWLVDGQLTGSDASLVLDSSGLPAGIHRIELEVRDDTASVLRDPALALVERFRWTLTLSER